ncbi:MAG: flavodoxin-dependent (E)-4-hydroxy-3-methylbut-2-enyl-diphosphate synthase [Oscillospiraceae bacterium]|nr:flavodoxin-dependent (E)-4-hydroxy-3-methylbut-2-enyl-diphosphate synthase [Oscillospiraceae bacterium]
MRKLHPVKVGNLTLDGRKIYIQSMLNVPAEDIEGSIRQAVCLEKAGCEIIRASIPDMDAVRLIPAIKNRISIPLVADIHFDYKVALECAAAGVDKIRINPGNIGGIDRVKAVADCCRAKNIPIRIGVNSGSLEKELLAKYGHPCAEALVESALNHASLLEKCDFEDIVISIKSSDVKTMIEAYRLAAERTEYPLHLGVTEAGTERMGIIKSAVGIGSLLCDGIGETIRVSLTEDPVREIAAAKDILMAVGKGHGVRFVSCPTCGRTKIDLVRLAAQVENAVRDIPLDITVAVMGCAVNGPGEAREADIGIAGGDGCAVIFRKGELLRKVREEEVLGELLSEIDKLRREDKNCL